MVGLILVAVYLLSSYGAYKFIQLAHYSEIGRWKILEPGLMDIAVSIVPVTNSILAIGYLFGTWKDDAHLKTNFFKIKK